MLDLVKGSAAVPCIGLVTLHIVVLAAGFIAPYDPAEQNRDAPFLAGTPIHILDDEAAFRFRVFVCRMVPNNARDVNSQYRTYVEDCSRKYGIHWFVRRFSPPTGSEGLRLFAVDHPGRIYLMGTDQYGRDQFSRFLHGGRLSLFAGILACALAISVGIVAGAVAGFYGGLPDAALMWASEVFQSLPWIFFLFGLRALLPLDLEPATSFFAIVTAIGIVGWARPARLVRNAALSAKEREYVLVACGFGASDFYLLRSHILPATMGVALTQAALLAPRYILAEITLTFFGLGVNEPAASWGQMLSMLVQYSGIVPISAWMYVPVFTLVLTCYSYLAVADALRTRFVDR
jgi:peptide/nickel transport system permease protein